MYEDGSSMVDIEVPNVQQQFGSSAWLWIFAIAFTVHLALGDDPWHILFEQSQMRLHLNYEVLSEEDGAISTQESGFNSEAPYFP